MKSARRIAAWLSSSCARPFRRRLPIPGSRQVMRGCATTSNCSPTRASIHAPLTPGRCPGPKCRATWAASRSMRAVPRGSALRSSACRQVRAVHRRPVRSKPMRDWQAPRIRWRFAALATCRARKAKFRRASSTRATDSRIACRRPRVADPDDDQELPSRWQLWRRRARQLDAACGLHRSLVGPGLGGEPDLRQQRAADSFDHDRAQLFGSDRASVARMDRALALRRDDGPVSKTIATMRRTPISLARG